MTTQRRDGSATPLDLWISQHPQLDSILARLSITDSDKWIHRYSVRRERGVDITDQASYLDHIMLLEIKTYGRDMPMAQRDTFDIVEQILRLATVSGGRRRTLTIVDTRKGRVGQKRRVCWLGLHTLKLSGSTPDDSSTIWWDEKIITADKLISLLRMEADPDAPNKKLCTRRHHKKQMNKTGDLNLETTHDPT